VKECILWNLSIHQLSVSWVSPRVADLLNQTQPYPTQPYLNLLPLFPLSSGVPTAAGSPSSVMVMAVFLLTHEDV
jgi:hypothetical protein